MQIIKEEFTARLRTIETYDELIGLLTDMSKHELCLRSKKRKRMAYDFTHLYKCKTIMIRGYSKEELERYFLDERFINRVEYLFDDGVSIGESYVKNLYKNLEVY